MARGVYFQKLRLEEYTVPSSLCLCIIRQRFGIVHATGYRSVQERLELYHKLCISGNKIRWKLQLIGFSYDKKSANVVMWKDKEYEYISSA